MAAKNFTKTATGTSDEALTTNNVWAEWEVFIQAPDTNSLAATVKNEDGQIIMVLNPGTRDRYKVDKTRVPDPASTVKTEKYGDCARLSEWTAAMGAGDKVYVNAR